MLQHPGRGATSFRGPPGAPSVAPVIHKSMMLSSCEHTADGKERLPATAASRRLLKIASPFKLCVERSYKQTFRMTARSPPSQSMPAPISAPESGPCQGRLRALPCRPRRSDQPYLALGDAEAAGVEPLSRLARLQLRDDGVHRQAGCLKTDGVDPFQWTARADLSGGDGNDLGFGRGRAALGTGPSQFSLRLAAAILPVRRSRSIS